MSKLFNQQVDFVEVETTIITEMQYDLQKLMTEKGYTVKRLAKESGVKKKRIKKMQSDKANPTLKEIARIFCTLDKEMYRSGGSTRHTMNKEKTNVQYKI